MGATTKRWFVWCGVVATAALLMGMERAPAVRSQEALRKLQEAGNWKEAFDGYKQRLTDPKTDPAALPTDLRLAVQCLQRLGRVDELDGLVDAAAKLHADNPQLLRAAAHAFRDAWHHGQIVAGEFTRGNRRNEGQWVNSEERDRVRALQLLLAAAEKFPAGAPGREKAEVQLELADLWVRGRGPGNSWKLQQKTDLTTLPDFDEYHRGGWSSTGAPVDAAGKPVFHPLPKSFEAAENDGQRRRWALLQAVEFDAARRNRARWQFASFLKQEFDVRRMVEGGFAAPAGAEDGDDTPQDGPFSVHTLGDDETMTRLATGIRRFKLPDEFNFIKIFKDIAAEPQTGYGSDALDALSQTYLDRRQYPKSAAVLDDLIRQYGNGPNESWKTRLAQIRGKWGQFEPIEPQLAGEAKLHYKFRNGTAVTFKAWKVDLDLLLTEIKAMLQARPKQVDWSKITIDSLGQRIIAGNETKYLKEKVAEWKVELKPLKDHFDRRQGIVPPLPKAGAYLVTAEMNEGNVSRVMLFLFDTVLFSKPLQGGQLYCLNDGRTGQPLAGANLEVIGFRQEYDNNRPTTHFLNFAEKTDAQGQAFIAAKRIEEFPQRMTIARGPQGQLALIGFGHHWWNHHYDAQNYQEEKAFFITDRPVYRPKQAVQFKVWLAQAKYGPTVPNPYAERDFTVVIYGPTGEEAFRKTFKSDRWGGLAGQWDLPADAKLGLHQIAVENHGGSSFRVEEYKKPEFEVTIDTPAKPTALGEKIQAEIQAKYYFGGAVTNARVKYKILRTTHDRQWYPIGPWDWLYGRGYLWCGADYAWYPGWNRWGCARPMPWWWHHAEEQPEVVAESEVAIGPDGKVSVEIDTAVAKAFFGEKNQRYEITAEVTDESRRTIVGTGEVLVSAKPFDVTVWIDRGYAVTGDTLTARIHAETISGKPVPAQGTLKLFRIRYDAQGKPTETEVEAWPVTADAEGNFTQQFKAPQAGQYRLAAILDDADKHRVEGGCVVTVVGDDRPADGYRFNDLELSVRKIEYKPGEKAELLISTNRADGFVLLFLRPSNGTYLKPETLRLKGKSTTYAIPVAGTDMPNFFVEAVTVSDGKIHTEVREILVPPEDRIVKVAVEPNSAEYLPGAKGSAVVKVTDATGEPVQGTLVAALYDKSVEYVSGGSNVPEIRKFFWDWRRSHHVQTESDLGRVSQNIPRPHERTMGSLGVFGDLDAEFLAEADGGLAFGNVERSTTFGAVGGLGGGGGGGPGAMRGMPMPAAAPAMEAGFAMPMAKSAALVDARATKQDAKDEAGPAGPQLQQPTVRTNFADTAMWVGKLETDAEGKAKLEYAMPESLTTWKLAVWGLGAGTRVGESKTELVTRKNLIVRLQAPRFFVQTDEVVLSANVHNHLKTEKLVQVRLELEGNVLDPLGETTTAVKIPAHGEKRVDWRVKVKGEGQAVVRMSALTDEESDAMQMSFPAYIHGFLKTDSYSGALRPEDTVGKLTVRVPAARRAEQTRLEVRFSPTLAGAVVDALPYLAEYPYGCTEQTLNRFLPSVVVRKTLQDSGIDLAAIRKKTVNLNAQEIGDPAKRAERWKRFDRNPVFDPEKLDDIVKTGVQRLTEMQLSDGGWGWFSGYGELSAPHTTAVVVHGLLLAQKCDVALTPDVLTRGLAWLERHQTQQIRLLKNAPTKTEPYKLRTDDLDALVFSVLTDGGRKNADMLDYLYRDRLELSAYSNGLYGLALEKLGEKDKLAVVLRNLAQFVVENDENQTARLQLPESNRWWYWYGDEIEAMATYLQLLNRHEPQGRVASRLAKYLVNNRKHATYWNSTRDTALCVEALCEFMKASGEQKPDLTVQVVVDGQVRKEVKITPETLFTFDNVLLIEGDALPAGEHVVELRKTGKTPLYYNAYLTNFTMEDSIKKAGLEVKVGRKYYKLTEKEDAKGAAAGTRGQVVEFDVEKYDRNLLPEGAQLKSGDLVEVELEIDSKNDYEYLLFEDMKAAGFEAVDVRSGYVGKTLPVYMEVRDNRVCFFLRTLPRGKSSVAYRLRAEIPGSFSALPAAASAMYAPELRGNSDEMKLRIAD